MERTLKKSAAPPWHFRSDNMLFCKLEPAQGQGADVFCIMSDNEQLHLWRPELEWLRDQITALLAGEKRGVARGRLRVDESGNLIPPDPVARPPLHLGGE